MPRSSTTSHMYTLATLATATIATGAFAAWHGLAESRAGAADDPALTLTRITEIRAKDVEAPKEGADMMFMPSDEPGLTLKFNLKLPAGARVMSLQQPAKVVAADSAGTDLSKIEPGFRDELEYVDLEHDFKDDDDVSQIMLKLAPSSRKAETFDVLAEFAATVFTGSKPLPLALTGDWQNLPADAADLKAPARIRATDDGVAIEPASIEAWLEKIELQTGDKEVVESNGWFSDGSTINYMFDGLPKERPLKATLTLRTGVKTVPLTIDLKKQALP